MKAKKVLALVLCAALLVAGSVAATLAYLTSQTQTIKNTFTVGNVSITLVESVVDEYGNLEVDEDGDPTEATTATGNEYKLIPGHTYVKDPTITVDATSEDCYLFVKVENGISEIATIEGMGDWSLVGEETNVFAYKTKVSKGAEVKVFESFTIADDAAVDMYGNKTINVTAYAVQADNFGSAAEAWEAAPSNWQ